MTDPTPKAPTFDEVLAPSRWGVIGKRSKMLMHHARYLVDSVQVQINGGPAVRLRFESRDDKGRRIHWSVMLDAQQAGRLADLLVASQQEVPDA